jgi:hypothetical protein
LTEDWEVRVPKCQSLSVQCLKRFWQKTLSENLGSGSKDFDSGNCVRRIMSQCKKASSEGLLAGSKAFVTRNYVCQKNCTGLPSGGLTSTSVKKT